MADCSIHKHPLTRREAAGGYIVESCEDCERERVETFCAALGVTPKPVEQRRREGR